MGYNTSFADQINIVPPLSAEKVAFLVKFSQERHDSVEFPGWNCQWVPTEDGTAIVWDEGEKFYQSPEWMDYLIKNHLQGYVLNGTISAQGEEPDDMWLLHVKDNRVSIEELVAMPSGKIHPIGDDTKLLT